MQGAFMRFWHDYVPMLFCRPVACYYDFLNSNVIVQIRNCLLHTQSTYVFAVLHIPIFKKYEFRYFSHWMWFDHFLEPKMLKIIVNETQGKPTFARCSHILWGTVGHHALSVIGTWTITDVSYLTFSLTCTWLQQVKQSRGHLSFQATSSTAGG